MFIEVKKIDTRSLVVQILNEKNPTRQRLLLGYHRHKLSEAQLKFINNKLNNDLVDYAVNVLGWKKVNEQNSGDNSGKI